MPLLQEAYYHFTMKANWLMPKQTQKQLWISSRRVLASRVRRRLSHERGQALERKNIGREKARGQDEDGKRSCLICIRKEIVLLLKSLFIRTSPSTTSLFIRRTSTVSPGLWRQVHRMLLLPWQLDVNKSWRLPKKLVGDLLEWARLQNILNTYCRPGCFRGNFFYYFI